MDEDAVLQLVGKLLDVAQDSGGRVGPRIISTPITITLFSRTSNGLVRFVLEDFDKLQEEAYEKAIADARAVPSGWRRLSKVELGPDRRRPRAGRAFRPVRDRPDDEVPRKRLEVGRFQEIPIRVELLVRFSIQSKPDKK